jgi:hypothetical protein
LTGHGGASDNGSMTLHIPRLPFSLDPLIAEAKRRARQRRLLLAVLALVALGGAGALALGSSGWGSGSGGPAARFGLGDSGGFRASPGWQVGHTRPHTCVGVSRSRCVQGETWAATIRYRDCGACSPPHKTLAALPPSGIVIQVTRAREHPPYGPLGSWPPTLRAAQAVRPFEGERGHIAVIQRFVRSSNGVEHSLFVWFGRGHPTARQIARANAELRTVRP